MKTMTAPNHLFGMDLLRIWAMFSVLALHFFLYSDFYHLPSEGMPMLIAAVFRTLFYQCVPLFLMMTGALKRNAVFGKEHYVKLIPVLLNSVVVGLIVVAYKILYLKQDFPVLVWLQTFWRFEQPSYGWYLNLYISLYLLIPLINAGYHALQTRKQKFIMVCLCVFVTMAASSINQIPLPSQELKSIEFVPDFFQEMWALGYYMAGMYIAEFRPKIHRLAGFAALVISLFLIAMANQVTTTGNFYEGVNFENGDCVNLLPACLIFLLLYDIEVKCVPVRRIAAEIAALSMTVYLFSWIGDQFWSSRHTGDFAGPGSYPMLFMRIIPLHFVLSCVCSFVIAKAVQLCCRPLMKRLLSFGRMSKKRA